jgi:hypothetical protein
MRRSAVSLMGHNRLSASRDAVDGEHDLLAAFANALNADQLAGVWADALAVVACARATEPALNSISR